MRCCMVGAETVEDICSATEDPDDNNAGLRRGKIVPSPASQSGYMDCLLRGMQAAWLPTCGFEWIPRLTKQQTVLILDWDDTCLCTTFLQGVRSPRNLWLQDAMQLERVAVAVLDLLSLAKRLGDVIILTNAREGWVQSSARVYMPCVLPALLGVRIVSARAKYEHQFPRESSLWKTKALLALQDSWNTNQLANIVSIGDSRCEIDAARTFGKVFSRAYVKTVKFKAHPTPRELEWELKNSTSKLRDFVGFRGNLHTCPHEKL